MRTLTVISGPAAGASMPVADDVIVVGREGADLTIEDSELSRRHASIRSTDGGVLIEDLGSTNGTFVDGERISEPVVLTNDGTIRVGSSVIAVALGPSGEGPDTRVSTGANEAATEVPRGPERGGGRTGRGGPPKKALVLLFVLALVVAGAVIGGIALTGGSGTKARTLNASLKTLPLGEPTSVQASGVLQGEPLGRVEAIFIRQLASNPRRGGSAVKLTGTMLVLSPSGIIGMSVTGTLRITRTGREVVLASGSPANGTGDYKDVKGSFTMTGGRPNGRAPYGEYKINGTLEY